MPDIKLEDYLNGVVLLKDTDLVDVSVDLGGGLFDSQKMPIAVLKLALLGIRRFKVTRSFNDYTDVQLEQGLVIFQIPAGFELTKRSQRHTTKWLGGAITEVTSKIGVLGILEKYSPGGPFDIFQNVGDKKFDPSVLHALEDYGNLTDVRGTITAVGDTLNNLTQGDIEHIFYIDEF